MPVIKMTDLDLGGKRVLIRADMNVPVKDGRVTNDKRIRASLPTIEHAIKAGAAVMVMSHLGRPTEGEYEDKFSLAPVAEHLSGLLGKNVRLVKDWLDGVDVAPGELVLCENVRFLKGEKANDDALAKKMAALCDIYVDDAFGTAHRAQASTHGVAKYAPVACAGLLLSGELTALDKALQNPKRPMIGIFAGSKVSTKLTLLNNLINKVDGLIVGGGIANTFIAAAGYNVGKSLHEPELIEDCKKLMEAAKKKGAEIPLPVDVVCGNELSESAKAVTKPVSEVTGDEMILDIGPKTVDKYKGLLERAGTIVWNGPVGAFEIDQFGEGTKALGLVVAESDAFSMVGGGDTVAAVEKYGLADKMSYISTGGGSFMEFMEGKTLPAIAILEERAAK